MTLFPASHRTPHAQDFRTWSTSLRLDGSILNVKIWAKSGSPTTLEIRQGGKLLARKQEARLFYEEEVHPYLWVRRRTALLAYAAGPSTGSGFYASVWRISKRGRGLDPVREFRDGDLRQWRRGGVVREFRPAKYATAELERALHDLYDARNIDRHFIICYQFDRQAERFRFLGYRIVPPTYPWPETVRLPSR